MSVNETESVAQGRLELGLAGEGALRWAVVNVTDVVEEARERLDLSPVAAAALGRSLAAAALLLRMATKTPTRLVLEVRGDGPLGRVLAEVDQDGNLRGMVGNAHVDLPPTPAGKLDVGAAVGSGFLRVLREHEGGGSYHSQVELVTGEIGDDVAHYLEQSEQSRSAVLLGVLAKPSGIAAAGGMIIEVLPGAPDEVVQQLESNIASIIGVSHLVEAGGIPYVIDTLLAGMDRTVKETRPLRFRCRCSRERLLHHLILLSTDDKDHLSEEDGSIEADCVFCGAHYRFATEELNPRPN
jgi:molecular chaperone Hsp33